MFTEQQQLDIVRTALDGVFYQNFEYGQNPGTATAETAELFKPRHTEHQAYIEEIFKGVSLYQNTGETQTVGVSIPKVANKLIVPVQDWTQSIPLSKNLFDDNLHGVWAKSVADMALKARRTMDFQSMGIFRGAFSTTLTADGSALCGTHTLLNGQVINNSVGALLLNFDNFTTAVVALQQQPDHAGVILGSVPAILLVPPALFTTATQLTQSVLQPFGGDNSMNVYRSPYDLVVYTSPYLGAAAGGYDTYWFLLGRNHSITRLIRQGIETYLRHWGESNDRTYYYQANYREAYFASDYVGVVGSTGNGS